MSVSKTRDLQREWQEQKGKPHLTVDEKYDMLVLRDKIIRACTATAGSGELSEDDVVIVGVCPEMCPEKERYERVKQGRVDSFEKRTRMIKDFSRQAADQDMPLPTELRTAAALRTTMNFLLREIIANPPPDPDAPSGWYDFVWRRVRAIRKEITQQRLSGPLAAAILEDMCRFHIIAFHMFCQADQNQFAPKLNLENLNDCLATLGRIYAGGPGEVSPPSTGEVSPPSTGGVSPPSRGEVFPNMAEFRAYEMMLRVWTGKLDLVKTTAEVENLPDSVKKSKEIQLARRVISAVNNRLFNEYFMLFSSADYVTACLLHYSLPMVQAKALDCLATASGSRSKTVQTKMSAKGFSSMLGLREGEELLRFTNFHGLLYEVGAEMVFFPLGFSRSRDPKMYPRMRSLDVVEGKRAGRSLAEIVAKKSIEDILLGEVVEIQSFDEEGMYVGVDPWMVSFDKENVSEEVASRGGVTVKANVMARPQLEIPHTVVTLPRPPFPRSPRPVLGTPRFPILNPSTQSSASPRFSAPFLPSLSDGYPSPDRKRSRPDDADTLTEHKRLHHEGAETPPEGVLTFSVPQSPVRQTPRLPSPQAVPPTLSRQTSKTPSVRQQLDVSESTQDVSESRQDRQDMSESRQNVEKVYPSRTHLQVIRARTVCQASVLMGTVFRAWWSHATRHRRPSNFFGQVEASFEQKAAVEKKCLEELNELVWMKFPFRSSVLKDETFHSCMLLFLYVGGEGDGGREGGRGDGMEEWLRAKLGDPTPSQEGFIRIMTYEGEEGRVLRIVFLSLPFWSRSATTEIASEIETVGADINGVVLYTLDQSCLTAAKDFLNTTTIRTDIPLALFCHDETLTHFEMENDLPCRLILDVLVPQGYPTLQLSDALWEGVQTVIEHRVATPFSQNTTLLRLLAEVYCSFVKLCRVLKREGGTGGLGGVGGHVVGVWNGLVDDYFSKENVEVFVEEKCCEELVDIVERNGLSAFLKVDEATLWETPGRFPEVFPFSIAETENSSFESSNVFAAVSEKVLTLSAMAAVCDPMVRQNPRTLPDFELQLKGWLEKLDEESPSGRSRSSSYTHSSTSDREDSSSGYDTYRETSTQSRNPRNSWNPRDPVVTVDEMERVRQDTQDLTRWFAKLSKDLKMLDSV